MGTEDVQQRRELAARQRALAVQLGRAGVAPEAISANSLAVQVVDANGRVLEGSLAGAGGLAPLSRVVVVGRYRPSPDGQAAVLEATRLYVEKAQ